MEVYAFQKCIRDHFELESVTCILLLCPYSRNRRSHFQSETYKLVHEMDDHNRRGGPEGGPPGPPQH